MFRLRVVPLDVSDLLDDPSCESACLRFSVVMVASISFVHGETMLSGLMPELN